MSDMDRDGQMHTSHPAASEKPSLDQLEATFETAVSDGFVLTARLTDLQQTWLQRKPLPPRVLRATSTDAIFDLCHEDAVGSYYSSRDLPALYEIAKATPHLWHRVQTIASALHGYQQGNARLADEIGLNRRLSRVDCPRAGFAQVGQCHSPRAHDIHGGSDRQSEGRGMDDGVEAQSGSLVYRLL